MDGVSKAERERTSWVCRLSRGSSLGSLVLLSLTLFENTQLDTLVIGDGDKRVESLSDDEDVGNTSGEFVSGTVFDVDDFVASGVFLSSFNDTNTTQVTSSGDHGKVSDIELDGVDDLSLIQVVLNGIVFLDVGVRITDGSSVVSDKNGHSLLGEKEFLDTEKLELSFLGSDSVNAESSLDVKEETEVLSSLLNGDDILETSREVGIGSGSLVDLDESLHEDESNFSLGESVSQSVSQQDDERKTLSGFVRTG
jgi:hypothetical protein